MLDLGQINGKTVTTLNLSPSNSRLKPKTDKEFSSQVLPLVEDTLFDKCLVVLCLIDPKIDPSASRRFLHPQIIKLADRVTDVVCMVERASKDSYDLAIEWSKSYQQQCAVTRKIVDNLTILIKDHFCGSKVRNNMTKVKYSNAKCEALELKLKCLELEILNATYTKDSVAALRKVKNRLMDQMANAQKELLDLSSTLEQYSKCGPEFCEIVKEYARLRKEIEGKKWALGELRNN